VISLFSAPFFVLTLSGQNGIFQLVCTCGPNMGLMRTGSKACDS